MELRHTLYEVDNGVALVTLHRPDRMNAFTNTMKDELIGIFREASRDDAVRAVVVTGAGKAFCAGADLGAGGKTFDAEAAGEEVGLTGHRDGGGQVTLEIFACRKPVIAAINGPAVGVGITMTLPMDVRVVSEDAKIGFVFARRGTRVRSRRAPRPWRCRRCAAGTTRSRPRARSRAVRRRTRSSRPRSPRARPSAGSS